MTPVVLFRASLAEEEEMERCKKYFRVITQRTEVRKGDLVIPRYSALPFYKELEEDVINMGGQLINSYAQHCYVADLRNWYHHLGEMTPRTWFSLDQIPDEGPFVLKGQTNSKKHQWNEMMFARDKKEAGAVHSRLSADGYVGHQQIYIRQYVPLKTFLKGVRGLPITEEYRFFMYGHQVLASGFYWSEHEDVISEKVDPAFVPKEFLSKVANIISPFIPFYVVDVARTETGEWIVIELNDGQMSGLSNCNPEDLYRNLKVMLEADEFCKGLQK